MGQKSNPKILRTPIIRQWESQWFAKGHYFREFLKKDLKIRKFLVNKLKNAAIDKITIDKSGYNIKITITTARPGLIIGRGGVDIENLKKEIQKKFLDKGETLELNVQEIAAPVLSAQVLLETIIADLEKRVPYRRVMKRAIEQAKKAGALGVRVKLSGRLDGVEIARRETLSWGKMPLHTLRANIDYARGAAFTIYGAVGVKVWIYKGEVFDKVKDKNEK
jgi:small subunit ribosomal protein S3